MIVIGAQMAGADLKRSFYQPQAYGVAAWLAALWSPCCVCFSV